MFEGFEHLRVATTEAEIAAVKKGSGPPLLLIHGYPQTKAMWHKIAPALAERFTVVATDLRGYGASSRPPAASRHFDVMSKASCAPVSVITFVALSSRPNSLP